MDIKFEGMGAAPKEIRTKGLEMKEFMTPIGENVPTQLAPQYGRGILQKWGIMKTYLSNIKPYPKTSQILGEEAKIGYAYTTPRTERAFLKGKGEEAEIVLTPGTTVIEGATLYAKLFKKEAPIIPSTPESIRLAFGEKSKWYPSQTGLKVLAKTVNVAKEMGQYLKPAQAPRIIRITEMTAIPESIWYHGTKSAAKILKEGLKP